MALRFRHLLVLVLLGTILAASHAFAQAPKPASTPPAATAGAPATADVLPGLPRPTDTPQSLLQQPASAKPYSCEPLPGPYFERDPQLDPPWLPGPGWFTDVEVGILGPHVRNRLTDSVVVGSRPADTVHLGSADLDWTAAPRIEVGYRLPSGFGEFTLAYRFLVTDGTSTVPGADAPAALKSRLDMNIVDLDYVSREFPTWQWPNCDMKWRFGLRYADVYFDSRENEPFLLAAAGSNIFESSVSNNYWGIGPHAGVELTKHWDGTGLALVGQIDGATLLGRVHQLFAESATTGFTAATRESNPQAVPTMNVFLGLSWQPPNYPHFHFSVGYEYEYWWNVGRLSTTTSRGELSDQGILLRAEFNF